MSAKLPPERLEALLTERRDRMLKYAPLAALVPLAVGVLVFIAWDFWLDPKTASKLLWLRLGVAGAVVACALIWVPRASERTTRYIVCVLVLMVGLTISTAGLVLERGVEFGAPGMVLLPLLFAYYSVPERMFWLINSIGLAYTVGGALWLKVPNAAVINLLVYYVLSFWVGYTAFRLMKSQQRRLLKAELKLSREARTDELTALANRRLLFEQGPKLLALAEREHAPVTVAVLDLDHFKSINDRFGHEIGDEVLRVISDALRKTLRVSDLLARSGGEEFVAVLYNCEGHEAKLSAMRMLEAVQRVQVPTLPIRQGFTVSIGIATFPEHGRDWPSLLKRADDALYEAKRAGRARWVMAS
jgi:diguanylate cyclase (GGDEF)-like protein